MHLWNGTRLNRLSLQAKLVVAGMLILLLPILVIASATFLNSSHVLEEISKRQMVQISRSLSVMIRTALEKDLKILTQIAIDPQLVQERLEGRNTISNKKLAELYKVLGVDYEGLAIFDQHGTICADGADKNRIGISIADRNYFKAAQEGKPGIGDVVLSKATHLPCFGLCAPIISQDGNFLGGVLGILKADFLIRYVSSLKLGESGYAFMLDQKGMVISHPNTAYIMNFDVLKAPEFREFADLMLRTSSGTDEYTYEGTHKIAGFSTIELTGWKIVVTQNKAEIMELAYTNRNFILLISTAFIGLTVFAVLYFSRTISNPVQKTLNTLQQAISQATEAFLIIDANQKVQFVNPAMAAITGLPASELIGKPFDLSGLEQLNMNEIWQTVAEKKKWSGRITNEKEKSSMFTMELTITPVQTSNGTISGFLAIGRDITQELAMQDRIRQSEKMEAIGTLAGGIAHDFNNILSAIFGYTELTLNSLADPERSNRYLTEIINATKRARDLVNHILTFSRGSDLGRKPMIPKYVIREALKLLRASLPATIRIHTDIKSSAPILGEPTQVHQMIMNLCTNAAYAMKSDGGVIKVSLDEVTVDQDATLARAFVSTDSFLRLKISDSGCGIAAEAMNRIYDPFFTTKPLGEGTGLGLSVVHGIVKSLNGIITVSSKTGEGTLFTIYLPVIKMAVQTDRDDSQQKLPRGSARVMLVDDEKPLVQSGKERLEGLGYRVEGFTLPQEALETFLADPAAFDVIITDFTMPSMTGYELIKRVRTVRKDIPVILCSGYFLMEEKIRELDSAIEFVKKPVTTQEIARVLYRLLRDDQKT